MSTTLDDQYGDADPMKPSIIAGGRVKKILHVYEVTPGDDRSIIEVQIEVARADLAGLDAKLADDALPRAEKNPLAHEREVARLVVEGLEAALGEINAEPLAKPARVKTIEIPDDPPAAKPTRRRG